MTSALPPLSFSIQDHTPKKGEVAGFKWVTLDARDELKCVVYRNIINGSYSICYFSFKFRKQNSDLVQKFIARQIVSPLFRFSSMCVFATPDTIKIAIQYLVFHYTLETKTLQIFKSILLNGIIIFDQFAVHSPVKSFHLVSIMGEKIDFLTGTSFSKKVATWISNPKGSTFSIVRIPKIGSLFFRLILQTTESPRIVEFTNKEAAWVTEHTFKTLFLDETERSNLRKFVGIE